MLTYFPNNCRNLAIGTCVGSYLQLGTPSCIKCAFQNASQYPETNYLLELDGIRYTPFGIGTVLTLIYRAELIAKCRTFRYIPKKYIKGAISDLPKWRFPVKVLFILFFKYKDYTPNNNPAKNYNHITSFTSKKNI